MLKHTLATLAVAAGLLVAAGPANAGVLYNGHAGLGASAYQHDQTELEYLAAPVTDGTSNTIMFANKTEQAIEKVELRWLPEPEDEVL
jgi:hypothetical protein